MKIDRRRRYYLVLDVETANGFASPLTYDVGYAICDKHGTIYHEKSYIVFDVFYKMPHCMSTAYYAEKIPTYLADIKGKKHEVARFAKIWKEVNDLIIQYQVKHVYAYNANFDRNALNVSLRYLSKSMFRHFFPKTVKVHCIWHIACQTIFQQKSFFKFAIKNGLISDAGNIRTSAEVAYAYITDQPNFQEDHTGLEDVRIEVQILAYCIRQKKAMNKKPFRNCWKLPNDTARELGLLPVYNNRRAYN